MQSALGNFIEFMQTAFGILAGITAFFPLANLLIKVIPFPDTTRPVASTASSIASAFAIYFVFIASQYLSIPTEILITFSLLLFLAGIAFLFFIINWTANTTDLSKIKFSGKAMAKLVLFHILTFACTTAAFSALAAVDFWHNRLP